MSRILSSQAAQISEMPSSSKSSIEAEWEVYQTLPKCNKSFGTKEVLTWWRQHARQLPLLSEQARKWLCIPASSTSSERAFSASGNIVSFKRTKLQPENVDKLLYIQQNYDKVELRRLKLVSEDVQDIDEN